MKRFLIGASVFVVGSLIGAGALYVGLNWKNLFNPAGPKTVQAESLKALQAHLRRACATDKALRGAFVKSVQVNDDGVIGLRGLVAKKEQAAILEGLTRDFIEQDANLKATCSAGVASNDLKVVAIQELLAQLQRDFADGPGPDVKNTSKELRREVMRTTRLDGSTFGEDGTLTFNIVSIRDAAKPAATKDVLKSALETWLVGLGISAEQMPDVALEVHPLPNPVAALQKKLAQDDAFKGVYLLSSWYDGNGRLHFEGLLGNEGQRNAVVAVFDAYKKEPQSSLLVKSSAQADGAEITANLVSFNGKQLAQELQKHLVEKAREAQTNYLRRAWIADITPTLQAEDAKAGEEHPPRYVFQVNGRRLQKGNDDNLKQVMHAWLKPNLPDVWHADQTRFLAKPALTEGDSPIYALQQQVVERALDGAVFSDAIFDDQGRPELLGRHPGSDTVVAELQAMVKKGIPEPVTFSLSGYKDGLAWSKVVEMCRDQFAPDAVGRRIRLDRMYFRYDAKQTLLLQSAGVFLQDRQAESPKEVMQRVLINTVGLSAGLPTGAEVPDNTGCKEFPNPLAALQDLAGQTPSLDGVLLTSLRYDRTGNLQFNGMLGRAAHGPLLTTLLTKYLDKNAELVSKQSDPKGPPTWSTGDVVFTPAPKADPERSALHRVCQSTLTAAVKESAPLKRVCLERVYFKYFDADQERKLTVTGIATCLAKPGEKFQTEAIRSFLAPAADGLLTELADFKDPNDLKDKKADPKPRLQADIKTPHPFDLQVVDSPVFKLQDAINAKRLDGTFFKEAYYDAEGKLAFEGIVGAAAHLKKIPEMLDDLAAANPKTRLAPFGRASLASMRLIPWQPVFAGILAQFANGAESKATPSLFKHTQIKRAEFKYVGSEPTVLFEGIRIYYGKALSADKQDSALQAALEQELERKEVIGYKADVKNIKRLPNPVLDMQKAADERKMDGVFFRIGFDETGKCYVQMPFMPEGQEENVQRLIDEYSKKHPELGPMQLLVQ